MYRMGREGHPRAFLVKVHSTLGALNATGDKKAAGVSGGDAGQRGAHDLVQISTLSTPALRQPRFSLAKAGSLGEKSGE
jgi:hypothetical protein